MFSIQRYNRDDRNAWDSFVRGSRNGVFLFERDYLEYHAERFQDASLIVRDHADGRILAVLPANWREHEGKAQIESHGGLTFGGLVMHPKVGGDKVLNIFQSLLEWLKVQGVSRLVYRPTPHIYHTLPSEDDLYALQRSGARLIGAQLSSTIDLLRPVPDSKHRRQAQATARKAGVEVSACGWEGFWELLTHTLQRRHGVMPVHSLSEIQYLAARFEQIEVLGARTGSGRDSALLAGAVLYHYRGVTHTQYLAASEDGYRKAALSAVIEQAIVKARERGQRWFSFGASTYDGGRKLNAGLLQHKEMFGARSTILQIYESNLEIFADGH